MSSDEEAYVLNTLHRLWRAELHARLLEAEQRQKDQTRSDIERAAAEITVIHLRKQLDRFSGREQIYGED